MNKSPSNIRALTVETPEGQRFLAFDPPVSIYRAMVLAAENGYRLPGPGPDSITGEADRHPAIKAVRHA